MKLIKYTLLIFILVLLFGNLTAQAQTNPAVDRLQSIGSENGPYQDTGTTPADTLAEMIGTVINAFFQILGVIFIALTIYAGFNYMTARGEEAKVDKALNTLRQAIIGLVITAGSYAIWSLVSKFIIGGGK